MKYSVLMSVYKNDSPTFLLQALKSIYDEQSRKPEEIVVVFDGPLGKELLEVLDEFKKNKEDIVRYFPQKVNQGLGEALRIGAGFCTGDYIFRMDSDDISDPLRFEKQINYVESHPEIDALGTDIAEFQESIHEKMRVRACPKDHDDIVLMSKKRNPMNHVTACIKRESLERIGGYKSLLLLEDYYLWLRMIGENCRLANINESLVYVRVGNGFDTKRSSNERIKGWLVLQKYMLNHKMINYFQALSNMVSIYVFVKTPPQLKKWIYSTFLRK